MIQPPQNFTQSYKKEKIYGNIKSRVHQSLDEVDQDLVQEDYGGDKMSYAWGFISYATPEEFAPLLSRAKHWCYIHHNQDEFSHTIHILARFPTEMSLSASRKLQLGTQNLLGKSSKASQLK